MVVRSTQFWAKCNAFAVLVACFIMLPINAGPSLAIEVVRGPYLQLLTLDSVTIRWRTDVASNSVVHYGTVLETRDQTASDAASVTDHEVTLTGLSAQTRYYYDVGGTAQVLAGGDAEYTFETAPAAGAVKPTRIWVTGDSGTADANAREVRNRYKERAAGEYPADLWLMLGDNALDSGTDQEYQAAVFDTYPTILRRTPLWPTLGNIDEITANVYHDIFTLPTAAEAGGTISGTEFYYSFDYGNIHFISLNSMLDDLSPAAAVWTWLANDLAANDKDWVIAFWHHPPYSMGSHDSDFENRLIAMRETALPILEDAGVDLVLTAHSLSYERSHLLDGLYGLSGTIDPSMKLDGGGGREDGAGAYFKPTIGSAPHEGAVYAVAGSSGKIGGGSLNHPAMFVSLNRLGSMILDIYADRLDAIFLDASGATADYFTILKGADSTPPTVIAAKAVAEDQVKLFFAEPVIEPGATTLTNYAIDGGVSVIGADLAGDDRSVLITTTLLSDGGTYNVAITGVEDDAGLAVPPGTAAAFTYQAVVSMAFQDGVVPDGGYLGTQDTYIAEDPATATTNFGNDGVLLLDGDDPLGSGNDLVTLLAWDISDIPAGAVVESAAIAINVTNGTSDSYEIYEALRPWSEGGATWVTTDGSTPWETPGAAGGFDRDGIVLGYAAGPSLGQRIITLNPDGIAVIQNWVNGAANYGFVIANESTVDGLGFNSRDAVDVIDRPRLEVTYWPPLVVASSMSVELTILDIPLDAGPDDAEEKSNGSITVTSLDLEMFDYDVGPPHLAVGVRFSGVNIPQGAAVSSAYIQFEAAQTDSIATDMTIEGQGVDDAPVFTTSSNDITLRARTIASVTWSPAPWIGGDAGPDQRTANVAPIIEEIVNRAGWVQGNSLAFILSGAGERVATSYNASPNAAPILHVEYMSEPAANTAPGVSITGPADGASVVEGTALTFTGTANDNEDGNLSANLTWNSNLDGALGTGASVGATLSVGGHTITASVTDSGGLPGSDQITITVTLVNDAPAIASLDGDTLAYIEGDGALVIDQGTMATVTDADSPNLDTGGLTVGFGITGQAGDQNSIRDQGSAVGQIGFSGASITYGGIQIGTAVGGAGGIDLVVTFNANATVTAAEALVHNITFENISQDPSTAARTVSLILTDGDGGTSNTANVTVTVAAVNDAPVAVDDTAASGLDVPVVIDVLSNDSDLEDDILSVTAVGAAVSGTAAANPDQTISYTPDPGFIGSDSFTYTITDNNGGFDTAIVDVIVSSADITLSGDQSVVENTAGTVIGTLTVTAPGAGENYVFSVGDSRFEVVGAELKLKDGVRLDFEKASQISLDITATDGVDNYAETIVIAVNDVAEVRFAAFGDYDNSSNVTAVANLVGSLNVDFIVTTGDNVYGTTLIDHSIGIFYSDFIGDYIGDVGPGSAINRFFPSLGNHDYWDDGSGFNGGIDIYLDYFTLPGNERYYDFQMGPVHLFAINSHDAEPDGFDSSSIQAAWLQSELAASNSLYKIVYFHHAPYSSGTGRGTGWMEWPFEDWGATVLITGHLHNYERILLDENNDGIILPYFVSGLGGANKSSTDFLPVHPDSEFRYHDTYGTILIQASDSSITFEFYSIDNGGTLIDAYTMELPGANLPPEAVADSAYIVAEGGTLNETAPGVLGNDSDPEGDPLTAALVSGPANGILTLNTDGGFTYSHDGSETLSDSFTYKANDGALDSNTVSVDIAVTAVNDPPTLTAVADLAGTEDTARLVSLAELTAAGDAADVDGTVTGFRIEAVSSGSLLVGGAAVVDGATQVTAAQDAVWTPEADATGVQPAFTVVAIDDGGTASAAAVQVSVDLAAANDPPTLTAVADLAGTEDTARLVSLAELTAAGDAADVDGTVTGFRIEAVSSGSLLVGGAAVVDGATQVTAAQDAVWTPEADATGVQPAFTVVAIDDGGTASAAAVQVSVDLAAVNDPPTLTAVADLAGTEDTARLVSLAELTAAGDAADVDGTVTGFRIEAVSSGSLLVGGAAVVDGATQVTAAQDAVWTPEADATGVQPAFTVVAIDDGGTASAAAVQVSVDLAAANDPPTLTAVADLAGTEDTARLVSLAELTAAGDAADVDGTVTGFRIEAVSSGSLLVGGAAVVDGATQVTAAQDAVWTPEADATGVQPAFTVVAIDDGGTASAAAVQVSVDLAAANDPPTLTAVADLAGTEDTARLVSLAELTAAGDAADVDGTVTGFRIEAVSSGSLLVGGAAVVDGATQVTAAQDAVWTPEADATGVQPAFTVVAIDDGGTASAAAVQVSVDLAAANDPPTLTAVADLAGTEDTARLVSLAELTAAGDAADVDGTVTGFRIEAVSSGSLLVGGAAVVDGATQVTAAQDAVWTPEADATGVQPAFTVVAIDDGGTASAAAVQVSVDLAAVNDPPTLTAVADLAGTEDTARLVSLAELTAAGDAADVDGTVTGFRIEAVSSGSLLVGGAAVVDGATQVTAAQDAVWTPEADATGVQPAFTVVAIDDGGTASAAAVQVSVDLAAANDPPTLTAVADLAGTEDTARLVSLAELTAAGDAADVDGTVTGFRIEAVSSGSLLVGGAAVVDGTTQVTAAQDAVWTPEADATGVQPAFTVVAIDDGGTASAAAVQVSVDLAAANDPPTLTAVADLAGTEDTARLVSLAELTAAGDAADVDGTVTGFRIEAVSSGSLLVGGAAVVDGATQVTAAQDAVWTPEADATGVQPAFTVVAIDDGGTASAAAVQVSVDLAAVNDPPTLTAVADLAGTEDTARLVSLAELTAAGDAADVDGTVTGFRIEAVSSGSLLVGGAAVVDGATQVTAAQDAVWTPEADATGVQPAFTVVAIDDGGTASAAAVQVSVDLAAANDPPTLTAVADLAGTEDTARLVSLAELTAAGDAADVDGTVTGFRIEAVSSGSLLVGGAAVVDGATQVTAAQDAVWTPEADATGVQPAFTVVAIDDGGTASAAAVQVSVDLAAANDPPTLTAVADLAGTEDTARLVSLAELTAAGDAADVDGTVTGFRIEAVSSGSLLVGGAAVVDGTTQVTAAQDAVWTPEADATGVQPAFTVVAIDDGGTASAAAVQVSVDLAAVNDPPTLTAVADLAGTEDTARLVSLAELTAAGDAADVDGTVTGFRIEAVSSGSLLVGGAAVVDGTTQVTAAQDAVWTPEADATGVQPAFTVVAIDDGGTASAAAVQVSVDLAAANDPPTLTAVADLAGTEDTARLVSLAELTAAGDAADVDGTVTGFRIEAVSSGSLLVGGAAVVDGATQVTAAQDAVWTPEADATGVQPAFTVVAIDDGGTASAAAVQVSVDLAAVNDPPSVTLAGATASLAENTDTSTALKVADIVVTDDALGTNGLSLGGVDEALFAIVGTELFLAAGAPLDFETNPSLDVTVAVDDTAVGATPDDTAALTIAVTAVSPSVAYASSESTTFGTVSGNYLDTVDPETAEILTESHSGGKKSERISRLEHIWQIGTLAAGTTVTLKVTAIAASNSVDNFNFSYSLDDGSNYSAAFTVTANGQNQALSAALPSLSAGATVLVRVLDSDRTSGNATLDSLSINQLYIESSGSMTGSPPTANIESPTGGVTISGVQAIQVTATDVEDNASALTVAITAAGIPQGATYIAPYWQANWDSTTIADGNHLISVEVSDSDGNTASDSITVAVDNSPDASVHVGELSGSGTTGGPGGKWNATVTVTVHDSGHAAGGNGVVVQGTWSAGASGSASCTIEPSGQCDVSKTNINRNSATVTFTVNDLTGNDYLYEFDQDELDFIIVPKP